MRSFRYQAVSADGTALSGSVTAESVQAAARELRQRGLVATRINSVTALESARNLGRSIRTRRGTLRFSEEVATLLGAGITLERALEITADVAETKADAAACRQVLRAVRSGEGFADALESQPGRYSRLYTSMVRAGEAAGALPAVMERLAAFERSREETRGQLISALAYPTLLLAVGSLSALVLLWYVVPSFAASFQTAGVEPPLAMALMLGASEFVREWWAAVAVLLVACATAFFAWSRTDSGRLRLDSILLRAPVLGTLMRGAETAHFARAMATLLAAAVPILEALGIARSVLSNRAVEAALDAVPQAVRGGEGVARPITQSGAFPQLAGKLLVVGEETGEIGRMFDQLAGIYERQTRESLKRFAALLEPLVILCLGCLIGAMILGILVALTSIQRMGL